MLPTSVREYVITYFSNMTFTNHQFKAKQRVMFISHNGLNTLPGRTSIVHVPAFRTMYRFWASLRRNIGLRYKPFLGLQDFLTCAMHISIQVLTFLFRSPFYFLTTWFTFTSLVLRILQGVLHPRVLHCQEKWLLKEQYVSFTFEKVMGACQAPVFTQV